VSVSRGLSGAWVGRPAAVNYCARARQDRQGVGRAAVGGLARKGAGPVAADQVGT
jgi:hypothetical protein